MRLLKRSIRLLGTLLVASALFALFTTEASRGAAAPVVGAAYAAPAGTACTDNEEDSWLDTARRSVREERVARLREQEAERQEQRVSQAYESEVRQARARRQVAIAEFADLVPPEYRDLVLDIARQHGVEPRLLAAVGWVESQWYAYARGTQGDSGLMQILPSTGVWIASRLGMSDYDLYDPVTNLTMGAWYLRVLYNEYGSWDMALAAYNGGPRAAPRGAEFPYTRLVMSVYHRSDRA